MRRYLGKYDNLSVQDKLILIDNLTQRHGAGLTFGMQCPYSLIVFK